MAGSLAAVILLPIFGLLHYANQGWKARAQGPGTVVADTSACSFQSTRGGTPRSPRLFHYRQILLARN